MQNCHFLCCKTQYKRTIVWHLTTGQGWATRPLLLWEVEKSFILIEMHKWKKARRKNCTHKTAKTDFSFYIHQQAMTRAKVDEDVTCATSTISLTTILFTLANLFPANDKERTCPATSNDLVEEANDSSINADAADDNKVNKSFVQGLTDMVTLYVCTCYNLVACIIGTVVMVPSSGDVAEFVPWSQRFLVCFLLENPWHMMVMMMMQVTKDMITAKGHINICKHKMAKGMEVV